MPNIFISSANSQTQHPCPLVAQKGTPCHFGTKVDCGLGRKHLLTEFLEQDAASEDLLVRFLDYALGWCSCHNSIAIAGTALHYGISWQRFKSMSMCIWSEVLAGSKCLFGLTEKDLMKLFDSREKLVREEIDKNSSVEIFRQTERLTTPITRPSHVTFKNAPTSAT